MKLKKSLVRIVSKVDDEDGNGEEIELGFAAKVKLTGQVREPALITSSGVLPQTTENVFFAEYHPKPKLSFPKSKQKNPLRKVTKIAHHETMDVSFATYEGGDKDSNFLYYRYSPKGAKIMSAYVFDDREIIELQFENQGESYKLTKVSKKDFDVGRARGAPVICQLEGEISNVVVGVLGIKDNPDGEPILHPILIQKDDFKDQGATGESDTNSKKSVADKSHVGASGQDNATKPSGSSESEKKDESATGSSGAPTSDSQTSNQQSHDQGATGESDTNSKKSDDPAQLNITYNIVMNIIGDPNVVAIGEKPLVNFHKHPLTDASNQGTVEDAENNDQNAEDDDIGKATMTENSPVVVLNAEDDDVGGRTDNILVPVVDDQRAAEDDVGDRTDNCPVVDGMSVCREIMATIERKVDIKAIDCEVFAKAVAVHLRLDRTSATNLPPEIIKKFRKVCVHLKKYERLDIVEELRRTLPNGMTGPLGDENKLFKELRVKDKQNLTEAMSGNKVLLETLVTQLLRISSSQTGFYLRQENPAEKILDKFCLKRLLTVGELYDILVEYGAAALADEYF